MSKRQRLGPRPLSTHFLNMFSSLSNEGDEQSAIFPFSAIKQKSKQDIEFFLKAVSRYQNLDIEPRSLTGKVILEIGHSKLIHYPHGVAKKLGTIFIAPSLINKATILDLTEQRSFVQYYTNHGYDVYLIEWGQPDKISLSYNVDDYVQNRLLKFLDEVDGQVHLMGFCMGSVMAMKAVANSKKQAHKIQSLALFACPYDFHRNKDVPLQAMVEYYKQAKQNPLNSKQIEIDTIQMMFLGLDPDQIFYKFGKFMEYEEGCERFEYFVAMEDWVNDGVPLSIPAGDEMILGWYGKNSLAHDDAFFETLISNLRTENIPVSLFVADRDKIVPEQSTLSLIEKLQGQSNLKAKISAFHYDCGHTSLVAGDMAQEKVWQDYKKWLASI